MNLQKIGFQDKKSGMGEKPGFFPNGLTLQLQEKAGFPSSNHFFVLYTGQNDHFLEPRTQLEGDFDVINALSAPGA